MTLLDTRKAEVLAKLDVLVKKAHALWPKAASMTFTVRFNPPGAGGWVGTPLKLRGWGCRTAVLATILFLRKSFVFSLISNRTHDTRRI